MKQTSGIGLYFLYVARSPGLLGRYSAQIAAAFAATALRQAGLTGTIGAMSSFRLFLAVLLPITALPTMAQTAAHTMPDGNADAINAVHTFVARQTSSLGRAVKIRVIPPPTDTRLPPCARHEVFLPADTRLWGKASVGVKCSHPSAWTAYLSVQVSVPGNYLISARKINRGQTITEGDVELKFGDLTEFPANVLTETTLAVGQRAKIGLAANQPLTRELLHQIPVIKQGDKVRVLARGGGFSVATHGTALNNAAQGDPVKVKTESGRTLNGIATNVGEVELPP